MKNLVTVSLKRKINQLAERIQVTLNWNRDPRDSCMWDGKDIACKNQNASNIIHDIAHFAVASKEHRKLIDFGEGAGPETKDISAAYEVRKNLISKPANEELASALGIYWEKELDLNWRATAKYHCWDDLDKLKDFWKNLKTIT